MPPEPEADYSQIAQLDRLIHEPARLAIMATLAGCESADFEFLLRTTGLNKGNLSAHAIKLEHAGYIKIQKGFNGKSPYTHFSLTKVGRIALSLYQKQLEPTLARLGD